VLIQNKVKMILSSTDTAVVTENGVHTCRRVQYKAGDTKAILCGLLRDERYKISGGNKVWQEFEQLKVTYTRQHFCTCSWQYQTCTEMFDVARNVN